MDINAGSRTLHFACLQSICIQLTAKILQWKFLCHNYQQWSVWVRRKIIIFGYKIVSHKVFFEKKMNDNAFRKLMSVVNKNPRIHSVGRIFIHYAKIYKIHHLPTIFFQLLRKWSFNLTYNLFGEYWVLASNEMFYTNDINI